MILTTLDIDWACEAAIEETFLFLEKWGILPTVFATHASPCVIERMDHLEVGLHPFFDPDSSHGATIEEVVETVMALPHNIPAYRCHRFAQSNSSKQAMVEAGMKISSNVCTDLETVAPFKDRFGITEVPIFLEDGGYLYRKHPLKVGATLKQKLQSEELQLLLVHPMHIAINTPHFEYMREIKQSVTRERWSRFSKADLNEYRWKGVGVRDFLSELFDHAPIVNSLALRIA